jgi:hypothetical protein
VRYDIATVRYDIAALSERVTTEVAPLEARTVGIDYDRGVAIEVTSADGKTRYAMQLLFTKLLPNPHWRWWLFWRPRRISVSMTAAEAEAATLNAARDCAESVAGAP